MKKKNVSAKASISTNRYAVRKPAKGSRKKVHALSKEESAAKIRRNFGNVLRALSQE